MGRETPRAATPATDVSDIRMSLRSLSDTVARISQDLAAMPERIGKQARKDAAKIASDKTNSMAAALIDEMVDAIDRGDLDVRADLKRIQSNLGSELTSLKSTAAMSTENAKAVVSGYISHICQGE